MVSGHVTIKSGGEGVDSRDTVGEVAEHLNITADQVRALCRNGILAADQVEGDWRIRGATSKIYPDWYGRPARTDSFYMDLWRFLCAREVGDQWDRQLHEWTKD